jgi:tetratricopeptide (TPR) repeat protein
LSSPKLTTRSGARGTGQLGAVAYKRFVDGREAGKPAEQLAGHLESAANAYEQALQLLPTEDVRTLGTIHQQLGNIYGDAGQTDRALQHYRQSIQYKERQDDRYGAGTSRLNAAITLRRVGRNREALLYAQAALRDSEAVGPGGAAVAKQTRQLIALLEQKQQDKPEGGTDGGR